MLVVVNKDPENDAEIALNLDKLIGKAPSELKATVLCGRSPDDYNDVGKENNVVPEERIFEVKDGKISVPAHSLSFLRLEK